MVKVEVEVDPDQLTIDTVQDEDQELAEEDEAVVPPENAD